MVPGIVKSIHQFLHNSMGGELIITANGKKHILGIMYSRTRTRYIQYQGTLFMEQSKSSETAYGYMAKTGSKITWGMQAGSKEPVFKIVNNLIYYDDKIVDLDTGKVSARKSKAHDKV